MQQRILLLSLFFLIVSLCPALAQSSSTFSIAQQDSVSQNSTTRSEVQKENTEEFKMTKSPMGAILRTFALPGWGQLYNEQYWKAPIFFGAAATLTYMIISNHNKFSDKADQIKLLEDSDPNNISLPLMRQQREVHRDNRDMSAFYLGTVYLVAAIDAYVGAHLFDFTVDDNLSMSLYPHHQKGTVVSFSFSW